MGFRSLFKVRQPGHGKKFEARVASASKASKAEKVPVYDNSQDSGKKKAV